MVPEHECPDLHWKSVGECSGHMTLLPRKKDSEMGEQPGVKTLSH